MKFKKVTSSKYIGEDGYQLRTGRDGSFSIYINSNITKWGCNFGTVKSAELFLNNHDYIHANCNTLPISSDDINFIKLVYGCKNISSNAWVTLQGMKLIQREKFHNNYEIRAISASSNFKTFSDVESLLVYLDTQHSSRNIFSNVILRGAELRSIFAKANKKSSRDITNNLIRVKSSNVWAYGVEIKDSSAKVGDVYVQFKGPNGGPADIYKYYDVPVSLWRKFISYPSKGAFIWKYLRRQFSYSKLTGDRRGKLPNAIN